MSDNTSIFVRYNMERALFEVAHLQWDEQLDESNWEDAESFGLQSKAMRYAVETYVLLKETGVTPEYGITPMYDPKNLVPSEQTRLDTWTGDL